MKKAIIVSGYFNPLHKGHLDLFEKAKEIGDILIVIVNNEPHGYCGLWQP